MNILCLSNYIVNKYNNILLLKMKNKLRTLGQEDFWKCTNSFLIANYSPTQSPSNIN